MSNDLKPVAAADAAHRRATTRYSRDLPQISQATAEAEPPETRAFVEEPLPADLVGMGPLARPVPPAVANAATGMPAPAVEAQTRKITLHTTVEHRGRQFTIVAEGMTLDQFCDLLDKRGYAPPAQTQEWQRLPDGTPICPKHHAPMRQREKQGDSWWSHNVGTKDAPVYCKGYHGKDSPGYEL